MKLASPQTGLVLVALLLGLVGCGSDAPSPTDPESGDKGGDGDDDDTAKPVKDAGKTDAGAKKDAGSTTTANPTKDAGGSTPATGGGAGGKSVPCDVAEILKSNCSQCHGTETAFGAPVSLVTLEDFQGKSTKSVGLVSVTKDRINEPDPKKAMPPSNGKKLTAVQLATLNKWLAAGAPGSADKCGPTTGGTAGDDLGVGDGVADGSGLSTEGLDCFKLTAFGGGTNMQYKVGNAVDKYVNFTFKAPWTGTAYGIRFIPIIGNKKALHHFLLFQDSSNKAPGSSGSSGAHPDGQLVYGWAPGGSPLDLREATKESVGFELPGTTSYTVEMHYNSSDPAAEDASGVEVCVAKEKPTNIAGISWLGYDQLLVPSTKWVGECVPENTAPVHILGVQPHMHVAGTHMKTVIHRKGGKDEMLHDEPFDFNDQHHYLKNVVINPGDSLTTECTYDKPMAFGESTGQEMCYNFTFAYPKGALKDSGAWGGVAHGGSACLGQ
jgi:mono/diheme cytochrome c family protein